MLPGACACISWPRFATRCSASSSVKTPARHAATNSPTLWPMSAPGRTPQLHQSCASAYSTVNSAACANDVWRSASAASGDSGSFGKSTSRRSRPSSGLSTSAHASTVARKAGAWRYSPCAMSGCCEPWPGKRNATGGVDSSAEASGSAAVSARTASSWVPATTARRKGNALRPVASVWATSASESSGCAWRCAASRSAACARAAGVFADSVRSWRGFDGPEAGRAGASSSTTCALVPPTPNELTPARRGPVPSGHAERFAWTKKGLRGKSILGLGVSKCSVGGSSRCFSASTVLSSPATPAAAVRWPKLLFTEPMAQKPVSAVCARNACDSASTSMGSPSGVAVPCAST